MNRKIKICISPLIVCILAFSACQDLGEDAKSILTVESFFKTQTDLDAAVVGTINPLISFWAAFNSAEGYIPLMGADDLTHFSASSKRFLDFDQFYARPDHEPLRWTWQQLYKSILDCNTVVVNYQNVSTTEQKKNQAIAQVFFVRALCYFHLVQIWGDIPMPLSPEVDPLIKKTSTREVYAQIIKDLEFAQANLPENWSDPGRPTRSAAKALLAKVYLTNAGWPIKDVSMYSKAAAKAKEVIDLHVYELLPDYADLWKVKNNNNVESIFSFQHSATTENQFFVAGLASQPFEEGGWSDFYSEIQFFNDFPAGPRKDATFYTVFKKLVNGQVVLVPWEKSFLKHPFYRKFRDGAVDENNPFNAEMGSDFKMPYMRYADLLLIYAEAQCMSEGPCLLAYEAINQVRKRAGLPKLTPNLSQIAFRDSVIAERGWELAAERWRWFDLIRTEKLEEITLKRSKEDIDGYFVQPTHANYLAPIPQRDVDKNPNLK